MQYAIPAIIAMTASSLYNMVDSILIGHGVGPLAIAGVGHNIPVYESGGGFRVIGGSGSLNVGGYQIRAKR